MSEQEQTNQLAVAASPEQQGAIEVRAQVNQIQYLMQSVLREGEHYGRVPGTGKDAKPTLFQSGAEKIAYMFKLVPKYEVTRSDYQGGHREYQVECTLSSREGGEVMGYGVGLCSTLESKYRYRSKWVNGAKQRYDNPDIADVWNTVLKMAKKRAFVDAVKSTTAASDIFTQDVEDMPAYLLGRGQRPSQPAQQAQAAPVAPPPAAPAAPAPADEAWVAQGVSRLVAAGYSPDGLDAWLRGVWAEKGPQGAEAELVSFLTSAPGVGDVAVEPDEMEAM